MCTLQEVPGFGPCSCFLPVVLRVGNLIYGLCRGLALQTRVLQSFGQRHFFLTICLPTTWNQTVVESAGFAQMHAVLSFREQVAYGLLGYTELHPLAL